MRERAKDHMLTTGKLIRWLKQFPSDTLLFYMEMNTGDWQEMPDFEGKMKNMFFQGLDEYKRDELEYLTHYNSGDEKKAREDLSKMLKYVNSDEAVLVRC